jgi:hypothetical protein
VSASPEPAACPKCGRARTDGTDTCPRCGLVFARWTPELAEQVQPMDEKGARLWAELNQSWNDEALHDAFVKYCSSAGRLPAAGRLYRACLDRDPANALAAKMQTRIVGMATALMTPSQPGGAAINKKNWFWWVIIAGALGGLLASLLVRVLRR